MSDLDTIHAAVTLLLAVSVVFLLTSVRYLCRRIDIHERALDTTDKRLDIAFNHRCAIQERVKLLELDGGK